MTPYIRIPKLLRNTIVALVAAAGLWVGAGFAVENQTQVSGTPDALADGGQWGNKGGRGICA